MIELFYPFILFRIFTKNNNFSIFKKHFKNRMSFKCVKMNFFQLKVLLKFNEFVFNFVQCIASFFSLPFPRSKWKVWDGRKFKRRRGLGGPLKFQRHELQKKFTGSRYLLGSWVLEYLVSCIHINKCSNHYNQFYIVITICFKKIILFFFIIN